MSQGSNLMGSMIVSPGNVPVYHGRRASNPTMAVEKRLRLGELLLRLFICGSASLAVLVIATDSQVRFIFTIPKKATFTLDKSLVFLVVTNGIMASYSLVQVARCGVGLARGSVILSKTLAWAIFSGDQVMAYLSLSALAAALQSSAIAKMGQSEFEWMKICDMYEKFCNQGAGGITCAVVATLCAAITSLISAYSLFRLFGGNKGKSSGYW